MTFGYNVRHSGSYALLKVRDHQERLGVIEAIAGLEQVLSSYAVDGEYDIVLLIKELPDASIDQFVRNTIQKLECVDAVEVCHVELTVDGATDGIESQNKSAKSYAECFLFLETDRQNFEDIFGAISVLNAVTSCEVASGHFSLVLRMEAASFDALEKIINDKIRPLPGVLRAKESRIIKLAGA